MPTTSIHFGELPAGGKRLASLTAGQIVVADWRDAIALEPNKMGPAVVVGDEALFDEAYSAVLLVPLTDDGEHVIKALSVKLEPTPQNGCTKTCYAVSHLVAATATARVRITPSRISDEQLHAIRRQIAECIGIAEK